jgi:hypothetical protein
MAVGRTVGMVVAVGTLGIVVLAAVGMPVGVSPVGMVIPAGAAGVDIPSLAWQAISVLTDMIMQSILRAFVLRDILCPPA